MMTPIRRKSASEGTLCSCAHPQSCLRLVTKAIGSSELTSGSGQRSAFRSDLVYTAPSGVAALADQAGRTEFKAPLSATGDALRSPALYHCTTSARASRRYREPAFADRCPCCGVPGPIWFLSSRQVADCGRHPPWHNARLGRPCRAGRRTCPEEAITAPGLAAEAESSR